MRRVFLFALLIISLGLAAYFLLPREPRPNLIIISLDTVRADRLSLYGYERQTSPVLDEFAKDAVVFDRAVSVTSWTLPAHISLFSGQYPSSHGAVTTRHKVADETVMLAEILNDNGFKTFGFTGGGNVGARYGFARGFDSYRVREKYEEKNLHGFTASIEFAKETLSKVDENEPYFLFLHTYDAHCPYLAPEPFGSMFASPDASPVDLNKCGRAFYANESISPGQVKYLSDHYDGGLRWLDSNLEAFLSYVKSRKDYDRTIIVITSDHGEEFFEHGRIGHEESLHRELIMIPLLIRAPGFESIRVNVPVSLVDIFATVLELLSLPVHEQSQGRSLVPWMRHREESQLVRDFQFSELDRGSVLRSTIDDDRHFIVDRRSEGTMLYDVAKDPLEEHDLTKVEAGVAAARLKQLDAFVGGLARGSPEQAPEASKEEVERLKTLGYIQ